MPADDLARGAGQRVRTFRRHPVLGDLQPDDDGVTRVELGADRRDVEVQRLRVHELRRERRQGARGPRPSVTPCATGVGVLALPPDGGEHGDAIADDRARVLVRGADQFALAAVERGAVGALGCVACARKKRLDGAREGLRGAGADTALIEGRGEVFEQHLLTQPCEACDGGARARVRRAADGLRWEPSEAAGHSHLSAAPLMATCMALSAMISSHTASHGGLSAG